MTYKILPNLTATPVIRRRTGRRRRLNSTAPAQRGLVFLPARSSPIRRCNKSSRIRSRAVCAAIRDPGGRIDRLESGLYRTDSTNDIIQLASVVLGRLFHQCAGDPAPRRRSAGQFVDGPFSAYINYAYVDATYQFAAH